MTVPSSRWPCYLKDAYTSLKERAGVKWLVCPFLWRFRAGFGHAGRRAGVQVETPGWTNDLDAGPPPVLTLN
jgi:hypothetical protein